MVKGNDNRQLQTSDEMERRLEKLNNLIQNANQTRDELARLMSEKEPVKKAIEAKLSELKYRCNLEGLHEQISQKELLSVQVLIAENAEKIQVLEKEMASYKEKVAFISEMQLKFQSQMAEIREVINDTDQGL